MNPNILALDTATDACSIACCCHGKITEYFEIIPGKHSLFILEFIKKILIENAITLMQLDAIAFTCGPGSFTGLRLAASVVQGLAFTYNLPVIPISTLHVMAQGAFEEYRADCSCCLVDYMLVGVDARMREIYWGVYQLNEMGHTIPLMQDQLLQIEQVTTPDFGVQEPPLILGVGNAWEIYSDILHERYRVVATKKNHYPRARYVAQLGAIAYQEGRTTTAAAALPVYLRDDVVTQQNPLHAKKS